MLRRIFHAALAAIALTSLANASYCGKGGVPYSLEVLPSGAPVLGCAQPSCVLAPEGTEEDSAFLTDVNGQSDGFFRDGDRTQKRYRHESAPKLIVNCSGEFNELSCPRKNQWVGGIEYIDHPRQPLILQCCSFDGLRFSQEVGTTTVGPGEAITGGEVVRGGRQISFDVIANVRKIAHAGSQKVGYEVTVRRMNCLPDPPEPEVEFDKDVPEEVLKILSNASNKDLGTAEKFEKKQEQKKPKKKPKQNAAPTESLPEISSDTNQQIQPTITVTRHGNTEAAIGPSDIPINNQQLPGPQQIPIDTSQPQTSQEQQQLAAQPAAVQGEQLPPQPPPAFQQQQQLPAQPQFQQQVDTQQQQQIQIQQQQQQQAQFAAQPAPQPAVQQPQQTPDLLHPFPHLGGASGGIPTPSPLLTFPTLPPHTFPTFGTLPPHSLHSLSPHTFPTLPPHTFPGGHTFPTHTFPPHSHTFPTLPPHTFPPHTFPTFAPFGVTPAPSAAGAAPGAAAPGAAPGLDLFAAHHPGGAAAFAAPSATFAPGAALPTLPTLAPFPLLSTPAPVASFSPLPLAPSAGGQPQAVTVKGSPLEQTLPDFVTPPPASAIEQSLLNGARPDQIIPQTPPPPAVTAAPSLPPQQPQPAAAATGGLPGFPMPAMPAMPHAPAMGTVFQNLQGYHPVSVPGLGVIGYSNGAMKK